MRKFGHVATVIVAAIVAAALRLWYFFIAVIAREPIKDKAIGFLFKKMRVQWNSRVV